MAESILDNFPVVFATNIGNNDALIPNNPGGGTMLVTVGNTNVEFADIPPQKAIIAACRAEAPAVESPDRADNINVFGIPSKAVFIQGMIPTDEYEKYSIHPLVHAFAHMVSFKSNGILRYYVAAAPNC